jgi:hypothetical protein
MQVAVTADGGIIDGIERITVHDVTGIEESTSYIDGKKIRRVTRVTHGPADDPQVIEFIFLSPEP